MFLHLTPLNTVIDIDHPPLSCLAHHFEQRSRQPFHEPAYIDRLKQADVQISMDGKGRALDNIFTERLWRTAKYEEVYLHDCASPREAR